MNSTTTLATLAILAFFLSVGFSKPHNHHKGTDEELNPLANSTFIHNGISHPVNESSRKRRNVAGGFSWNATANSYYGQAYKNGPSFYYFTSTYAGSPNDTMGKKDKVILKFLRPLKT